MIRIHRHVTVVFVAGVVMSLNHSIPRHGLQLLRERFQMFGELLRGKIRARLNVFEEWIELRAEGRVAVQVQRDE